MSDYTRGPADRKNRIPRDITVTAKGWRWVGEQKLLAMARRLAMWQREDAKKKYPPLPPLQERRGRKKRQPPGCRALHVPALRVHV